MRVAYVHGVCVHCVCVLRVQVRNLDLAAYTELSDADKEKSMPARPNDPRAAHGNTPPWAVPELGSCASSERAWRLWAALGGWLLPRRPTRPLGANPLPRVLQPAAIKVASSAAVLPLQTCRPSST